MERRSSVNQRAMLPLVSFQLTQLHGKAVLDIESSGYLNETDREVLVNSPVVRFVGIGQCAIADIATDAQVIEFCLVVETTTI